MHAVIAYIDNIIWSYLLVYLLIGVGIFFTLSLGFVQIRHFPKMFRVFWMGSKHSHEGVSSFQALTVSLASRVGTGNIIGVAIAIQLGGPGAVFWMWVSAILGMATTFAESTLAQVYKEKDQNGFFRGGPAFYMLKGLKNKYMAVIFSIFLLVTYGLVLNAVQANAISTTLYNSFHISKSLIAIILVILLTIIVFGGIRRIAKVSVYTVSIMSVIYIIVGVSIILFNLPAFAHAIIIIFRDAFALKSGIGGIAGFGIMVAMKNGIRRGLFSNEAGLGSAPNIAASANAEHPVSQGFTMMMGVFWDTIVLCSLTAAFIIISKEYTSAHSQGAALTLAAINHFFPAHLGAIFLDISIFLFAFTSIFGNYAYAEQNIIYLTRRSSAHKTKISLYIARILMLLMVIWGTYSSVPIVWELSDVAMGLMALTNIIAIVLLAKIVISLKKDWFIKIKTTNEPVFKKSQFPNIKGIEKDIWN